MPETPTPSLSDSPAQATLSDSPPVALVDLSPPACAERLAALFPAVFGPSSTGPLKLRIQADIQQRAPGIFTKKALSFFLHRHTTTTAYLKALTNAAQRIDLDGQPAGDIAGEHREAAAAELARRRALHDARRAAERDAQRRAQEEARRARQADSAARGERVALLRAYEATTLTRANFCALKGLAEAQLEALLAQARHEREQSAQAPHPAARPAQRGGRPELPQRRPASPPRPPR